MRLSSWSQNACFVHTAIRSAVASNNDGEIQNMDLPFNHFWFRLTFSELQTIPLESLFVRMSLKRLQVFFPHTNTTEAPSVLSWRNIMSEVMTGRCFCARHTAGGAERTTWKSSCPWTVEHTLILYNTLWQDRLTGRASVLLSEGRWFNSHRHTWMYELLLLWTYVAI